MKLTAVNFNTTCRVVRASRSSVQKVGKVQTQLQKRKINLRNTREGLNSMNESLRYTARSLIHLDPHSLYLILERIERDNSDQTRWRTLKLRIKCSKIPSSILRLKVFKIVRYPRYSSISIDFLYLLHPIYKFITRINI